MGSVSGVTLNAVWCERQEKGLRRMWRQRAEVPTGPPGALESNIHSRSQGGLGTPLFPLGSKASPQRPLLPAGGRALHGTPGTELSARPLPTSPRCEAATWPSAVLLRFLLPEMWETTWAQDPLPGHLHFTPHPMLYPSDPVVPVQST